MKALVNNSYVRKQRSIDYEKYVRGFFKINIISLVEASSETPGLSVESGKMEANVFKNGQESPQDATLNEPVPTYSNACL